MTLESRIILTDDLKLYSDGLLNALKHDELHEAREYIPSVHKTLESISEYVESHIALDENVSSTDIATHDRAATEAERAVFAAKLAQQKAEQLERARIETLERAKRLKKAASDAMKEASKARKAADRAEKAERKAQKEVRKAAEMAGRANQAARRS